MFSDMLKTQLLLKNVITPEDWNYMGDHIQYDFLYDNHFSELKESELFENRLNLAGLAEPYVGKYYSQEYVRRNVLRQTDAEIEEQDKMMKKEIADGTIIDPKEVQNMQMASQELDFQSQMNTAEGGGEGPKEPEAEETPKPKGGDI